MSSKPQDVNWLYKIQGVDILSPLDGLLRWRRVKSKSTPRPGGRGEGEGTSPSRASGGVREESGSLLDRVEGVVFLSLLEDRWRSSNK